MPKFRNTDYNFYSKEKIITKDSFKFILKCLKKTKFSNLIDVGCSNGAFLNFISKKLKDKILFGVDIDSSLLKIANKNNRSINYFKLDITKKIPKNLKNKFDVIISMGLLGLFDNLKNFICNSYDLCKKNGYFFIFSSFNPNDYDIIVRVKKSNLTIWEKGFNKHSLTTTKNILKNYFKIVDIIKFNFNKALTKNKDPRRTYTIKLRNNKMICVNGLEQVSTKYLIIGKKI